MANDKNGAKERKYPQHVFLVCCGNGCKRITVSEIAYIEAMKDNCILHMKDETHHHLTCPMGDVEKDLNMDDFKRIHRSFIVNISFIAEYNFGSVVLENEMVVPIGRKYINSVKPVSASGDNVKETKTTTLIEQIINGREICCLVDTKSVWWNKLLLTDFVYIFAPSTLRGGS